MYVWYHRWRCRPVMPRHASCRDEAAKDEKLCTPRSFDRERPSGIVNDGLGTGGHGRFRWILPVLSVAGALVCAGQVVQWSLMGAWPFHDTVAYWLAGRHLLEGAPVYTSGLFLAFLYGPPWAVLWAPISLLPIDLVVAGLLLLQVLALRHIVGSWLAVGLVAWLPFVPRELATGNVDFLMAAAILAGIRGSGWPVSLFAFAKFSPAFVLLGGGRRQWRAAVVAGLALVAITLPWWHLWVEWAAMLLSNPEGGDSVVPLIVRLPIVVALLAVRRPWALAAGAALPTPAFHFHSFVLLLPAAVLFVESHSDGARTGAEEPFKPVGDTDLDSRRRAA